MLASSLRIAETYDQNHPASKYLLDGMIRYMISPNFRPAARVSLRKIKELSIRAKRAADVIVPDLDPTA